MQRGGRGGEGQAKVRNAEGAGKNKIREQGLAGWDWTGQTGKNVVTFPFYNISSLTLFTRKIEVQKVINLMKYACSTYCIF